MPVTQGAHHIGLTVPDLAVARDFFVEVLQFEQVGEVPDYPAFFVSDGTTLITLWQAANPNEATPFDRRNNIGLHHFALRVDSLDVLKSMHQTLEQAAGVTIEFSPEPIGDGPTQHMMFYIPGGIRMELIAPAA